MGPQPRYETVMDWCAARRRVTLWGGRADRFVDGKQWFGFAPKPSRPE